MPSENILIVEDEKLVAGVLASSLKQMGYRIAQTVSTGEDAIRAAEQRKPDLVLMDIHLQGKMDGIEAASQIHFGSDIPVVFVTGAADDFMLERSKAAEPVGFIAKPFSAQELRRTIETGLNSYRTSQQRNHEALQATEMRYRSLFENAVQGIFRIAQSGRFVDANTSFAEVLGYDSPEQLLDSAAEAKQYFVDPERHRKLLKLLNAFGFVRGFEFEAYRKDGTKVWLSQNTRSIYEPGSNEPYYEGIVQDTSERKSSEKALKSLLARQAALLAAVPDIIMEVDVNKVYTWANSAGFEFFGNDVIGKEAAYFFEGEQNIYSATDPLWSGDERSIYIESWQRRKDAQKRLLGWHCHVLKDHTGNVIGALSSARDITDNRLVEQERLRSLTRSVLLNQLQQDLLGTGELEQKLKKITEGVVDIFEADFCRIWLTGPGDLCEPGCVHAAVHEGPNVCRHKDKCLRLITSSGRYTQTDGTAHQRIPFGTYRIGRIASGEEPTLFTNDVASDPSSSDPDWAKRLGLVSFAGFRLCSPDGDCLGVLALFSKHAITPEEQAQMDALSATTSQVIVSAQADAALRQSEERFRHITEHIDEVFWVKEVDRTKLTYVSPAFERIWGLSRENAYKNRDFFGNALHPDDREQTLHLFYVQQNRKQPIDVEYRIIRPDGSIRHIWDRGFPIVDEDGRVKRYVGVAQDVTSWRQAEGNLRKSKEYLIQIINCIGDQVFVKDRQHRFLLVNDAVCAMLGKRPEEIIGSTLGDKLPKDVVRSLYEGEDRVFETGNADVSVNEMVGNNGHWYTLMSNKTLLTDADGDKQLIGVLRDITDLKRAEAERSEMELQLRQAQKLEAIGQLAAGIAHEINTPTQYVSDNTRFIQDAYNSVLPVLEAYGRLLQAVRSGPVAPSLIADVEAAIAKADLDYLVKEAPKAVTQSLEGLNRVATIVRAMKEFSHPGGEEKQPIDLNHAIENTVTVCRNEWKYVAEMVMDLDSTLPSVPCLPGDFNQVILNLVVNAAQAIEEAISGTGKSKGTIRISTRQDQDCVEIRIGDTGTGIPEEHRAKIFTPFFTNKGSWQRDGPRTRYLPCGHCRQAWWYDKL